MKKVDEAEYLAGLKRYAAAEAACDSAMSILESAPFAQSPIKEALAHIYLEEGRYDEARKLLLPLYHPSAMTVELGAMLVIADCHASRLAQAMDVLRALLHQEEKSLFFADAASFPIAREVSYRSAEATAYLVWGALQPGTAKHPYGIAHLQRAIDMEPTCGVAYFAMAWQRRILLEANKPTVSDDIAKLFRKAWDLGDPFLRKQFYPVPVPKS